MSIEFRVGGRKVNPNQIGRELEKSIRKGMKSLLRDHITKNLRSIRDPKTGKSPKILVEEEDNSNLKFKISGATPEEVKRSLKNK